MASSAGRIGLVRSTPPSTTYCAFPNEARPADDSQRPSSPGAPARTSTQCGSNAAGNEDVHLDASASSRGADAPARLPAPPSAGPRLLKEKVAAKSVSTIGVP